MAETIGFIIAVLLGIVVTALILNRRDDKISFKEGLDLTNVPVVTFLCGEKKLNFMLDTGSDYSFLDKETLKEIECKPTNYCVPVVGYGSEAPAKAHFYTVEFSYKGKNYVDDFGSADLGCVFGMVKESDGVQLHGILGSKFFTKYKYILDFENLTAYAKPKNIFKF